MIGGSSSLPRHDQTVSTSGSRGPATAVGNPEAGPGHAGRRADRGQDLRDRARLAVRDHVGLSSGGLGVVERGDQRVGRVVDVRRVDESAPPSDDGQPPGPTPLDDARRRAGCHRGPTRGAGAPRRRRSRAVLGEREPLGHGLAPAVRAAGATSGSAGPAGAPTSDCPAWATDGEETWTNRRTPAARAASRRQPGAVDVGGQVVRPGADDVDLRGQVDDRLLAPSTAAATAARVGDVTEHARAGRARPAGAAGR